MTHENPFSEMSVELPVAATELLEQTKSFGAQKAREQEAAGADPESAALFGLLAERNELARTIEVFMKEGEVTPVDIVVMGAMQARMAEIDTDSGVMQAIEEDARAA